MNKSWKTTYMGVLTIVGGLIYIFNQFVGIADEVPVVTDFAGAVAVVSAGLTGLFAKDRDVTGLPK